MVIIWSIALVMSSVNSLYFSRQVLQIVRSWQDAVYDTNTFVTMGTIAFYVFVEILPVMIVVD